MTAVAVALSVPAAGREYYVATTGSDDADGVSARTAWAMIGHGVSGLQPGDTLTILPGEYFESVATHLSGTPDAPIVIRAKVPGTVLMRGDIDLAGFKRAEGTRYTHWLDVPERVEGVADRRHCRVYQPMPSRAEVEATLASFHQDAATGRLYVHCADSGDPSANALTASVTDGFGILITPGARAPSVSDILIDGLSFTGYQSRELPTGPGSRVRWGLHVSRGERITVRRCTSFLNGGGIYLHVCLDCVVEDCVAFANHCRFQVLGNNILGWGVRNVTFRRNRVESFWKGPGSTSSDDITFYGGTGLVPPVNGEPARGLMHYNIAVNAGVMIKGAYGQDSEQVGNVAVGEGPYFYRKELGATNLLLPNPDERRLARDFADPVDHDYRLQSDSRFRGAGPDGGDRGPYPYRDEVFFVSPTGDDAAAGTSVAKAWKTLAQAARRARAGQTVYVMAGAYTESLVPVHSGRPGEPVRFQRRGRDRVVLDGARKLPVGVDLSGRSHVEIRGLWIRDFTGTGIRAADGENLRVEDTLVTDTGGDGVAASGVRGLVIRSNLLRSSGGAGLRVTNAHGCIVAGNIFDDNDEAQMICDPASLAEVWSDRNAFVPGSQPVAMAGAQPCTTLAAWREASGSDAHSLVADPEYRDATGSDFSLSKSSPLIGRGPHARAIGPYLRHTVEIPLPIEGVSVRALSPTAASFEWYTPSSQVRGSSFWDPPDRRFVGTVIEWGPTPACTRRLPAPMSRALFHTVSLTGLTPATQYFYRAASTAQAREVRFVPHVVGPEAGEEKRNAQTQPTAFQTPTREEAPGRVFHVAPVGGDANDGLSLGRAWRTVSRAAAEARAGDTVLVHAGTYEEHVTVRGSGDQGAPVTFRAAPGEVVWLDGSDLNRETAFSLLDKHHVCIDGFHFRNFRSVPHAGDVVHIVGGSHHVVQRCFYDGRVAPHKSYSACFLRAAATRGLTVQNCVVINGMGQGMNLSRCPETTVRHCVFYNVLISPVQAYNPEGQPLTLSHNLICANIPEKTGVWLIRLTDIKAYDSDNNGFFCRVGPEERTIVNWETFESGKRERRYLKLEDLQSEFGVERGSIFGNPGFRAVKELLPPKASRGRWRKVEMRWDSAKGEFGTLSFADFFADPNSPFARSAAGEPIGLDPTAFRRARAAEADQ